MPDTYKTKYYGIYIQFDGADWWIVDDLGGEEFFSVNKPTDKDVENYIDELRRVNPRAY